MKKILVISLTLFIGLLLGGCNKQSLNSELIETTDQDSIEQFKELIPDQSEKVDIDLDIKTGTGTRESSA